MKNYPSTRQDWYLNPFAELEHLQREMNRLFDYSFSGSGQGNTALLGGQWAPAIDCYDDKNNIIAKVDLPGLKKEEIEVTVQDNVLTIKGEKKRSDEIKQDEYIRTERFSGAFYRSITLPAAIDSEKVQAKFTNGVLELTLPKREEAKPKPITVDIK